MRNAEFPVESVLADEFTDACTFNPDVEAIFISHANRNKPFAQRLEMAEKRVNRVALLKLHVNGKYPVMR